MLRPCRQRPRRLGLELTVCAGPEESRVRASNELGYPDPVLRSRVPAPERVSEPSGLAVEMLRLRSVPTEPSGPAGKDGGRDGAAEVATTRKGLTRSDEFDNRRCVVAGAVEQQCEIVASGGGRRGGRGAL